MMSNAKLWQLLRLLPRDPVEFYDRVRAVFEVRFESRRIRPSHLAPISLHELHKLLEREFSTEVMPLLQEARLRAVEESVGRRLNDIRREGPFGLFHDGDGRLARTCYVVCRLLQPAAVLETGVAYGMTSAFLLQALHVNQNGTLFSIDLPPLGRNGDRYVGALIADHLRDRWRLSRGPTKRLMPALVSCLGQVDMFIHDSLHTYGNMKREFEQVWPFLKPKGVLIADDVEGNSAFEEFAEAVKPVLAVVVAEEDKSSFFGLMVKGQ